MNFKHVKHKTSVFIADFEQVAVGNLVGIL